ncbi:uncharacterized protein LOC126841315 isoform X2 [Adelges cooleyi]|uniref:uncharacterized protein LOC126841315 isoform X2 n=1 Tax=Adelges cooleyi TaxID=133065 RepID=UPI00217FD54F|nr:uncharacterized protein LOC126841315 isoform X2 [Adelges cooleyi]
MAQEVRNNDGIYMKQDISNVATQNVCFVCGNSGHSEQYWLRIRPSSTGPIDGTPHFPFLEMHEPPQGYKLSFDSKQENMVTSCYLCYSLLIGQWDRYEHDNVPARQRVYWLKRCDNGPFTGADLSTQGEYACQLLGLSVDFTNSHKDTVMSSAMSQITGEDSRGTRFQPTSASTLSDHITQQNGSNTINMGAPHSNPGSYSSSSGTDILDLSMPDKNSSTEVCYVCGEEFRRGSLSHVSAKPPVVINQTDQPFFPSLMLHPRPPRSRPMDSTGRVQTCSACHAHLLKQWQVYTSKGIPHGERNYILRKRLIPSIDTSTFVCFTCSLEYPSVSMRSLYCYPNNSREPYYPSLTKIKTPPGALPISPQGTVQVCAVCFKSVPQKHQVTMLMDLPVVPSPSPSLQSIKSPDIRFRPYDITKPNKSQTSSPSVIHQNSLNAAIDLTGNGGGSDHIMSGNNFRCYVCYEMLPRSQLKWLCTSAEGMNSHAMHFPCLKQLSRSSENYCVESQGRVLSCNKCVQQLTTQWNSMETNRVPLEHRRYNVPSLNVNGYNSQQTSNRNDVSSIYCFLCGYHSDLTYARVLYSHPQGRNAPYFPYLLKHETTAGSEQLREDGSALVCTFCYHGYVAQWRDFEAAATPVPQPQRLYNHKEYVCYVCTQRTGRHSIRSLAINDYPFLRYHRQSDQALLLENGEFAVVCVECYETIHIQALEYERFGMPLDKQSLQNSYANSIRQDDYTDQPIPQNMTIDKIQGNQTNKITRKNIKQTLDNSKRPIQSSNNYNSKVDTGLNKLQSSSSILKNPLNPNCVGQALPPSSGGRSFAAALRNLAKQAGPSSIQSNDKEGTEVLERQQQGYLKSGRIPLSYPNKSTPNDESKSGAVNLESRSGFQPYKPDEQRSLMSTAVSAPSHFMVDPASYSPYHPANLYSPHLQHAFRIEEQIYLERCGVPIFSPSPYHHQNSTHSPALYGLNHLQSPLMMSPSIADRMKMEEDRQQKEEREREKRERGKHQRIKNTQPSTATDLSGRRH